jgi:hypothetical protein
MGKLRQEEVAREKILKTSQHEGEAKAVPVPSCWKFAVAQITMASSLRARSTKQRPGLSRNCVDFASSLI